MSNERIERGDAAFVGLIAEWFASDPPTAKRMLLKELEKRPVAADAVGGEAVAWAISYDGKTPHVLWTEGNGAPLDAEVARLGGTACKIALCTRPVPAGPAVPEGWKLLEDGKTMIPNDWTWCRMEWEPGYPEDVAFGPVRMMERLKKWLDRYFAMPYAPQAAAPAGWIPVSERLPDDPQDCVFYSPDLRNPVPMLIGLYIRGAFKCAGFEMVNVTHWMPFRRTPEQTND